MCQQFGFGVLAQRLLQSGHGNGIRQGRQRRDKGRIRRRNVLVLFALALQKQDILVVTMIKHVTNQGRLATAGRPVDQANGA